MVMLLLTAGTVYRFRDHRRLSKLTGKRLLVVWGAALLYMGLSWYIETLQVYGNGMPVLLWAVLDWTGFVLFVGMLLKSLSLWLGKAGKGPKPK